MSDFLLLLDTQATGGVVVADTLHAQVHIVTVPLTVAGTLHGQVHPVPVAGIARITNALHVSAHAGKTSRITANTLHATAHVVPARSPDQARTLHAQVHIVHATPVQLAGAPFTYPGGFPAPYVRPRQFELHLLGRDGHDFGVLTKDRNRHLQHVLTDTGSGQAEVRPNEPLFAELKRGRILSAYVNGFGPVFDFLLEPGRRNLLTVDEEAGQGKVVGGRGTLAVLEDFRIQPQRLTGPPVEQVIVFDYSHPAYDGSAWVASKEIADQGNNPTTLWKGLPAQWTIPQAKWIWSSDGSATDAPGPATRWFRYPFAITPGTYVIRVAGDNAFALSMNGTPIVAAGDLLKTTGAFWRAQRIPIDIPAGTNVFGIQGQNYAPTVAGANPAGMILALTKVDTDGIEISTMFYTNSTWTTFPDLTPGAFPGVTVGMAMIWLLQQAQLAGGIEHLTWDFTTTHDSAGNPWDLHPSITAAVGDDGLAAFLKFANAAGLCDLRMVPGSPLKLQAFRPGEMIPASTASFDSPHLLEQAVTDPPTVVNAYLVRYDSGYFKVEDATSIAANGRVEGYLAMGNLNADEALVRATAQLALTKDPQRAQITLRLANHPTVAPYQTFGVGSSVPTRLEDGSLTAERVTSISVADGQDGDSIDIIPTVRDWLLEDEDRIERWLQAMANGAQSGIFQGASLPPKSDIPGISTSNDGEIIHQQGSITLGASPRHPIRRSGTARMFYLFLGGLLSASNITVDCLISDTVVTTATIIAGQRRSPLVVLDPHRVVEHDDWWSIVTLSGDSGGGTDLQGHLILE